MRWKNCYWKNWNGLTRAQCWKASGSGRWLCLHFSRQGFLCFGPDHWYLKAWEGILKNQIHHLVFNERVQPESILTPSISICWTPSTSNECDKSFSTESPGEKLWNSVLMGRNKKIPGSNPLTTPWPPSWRTLRVTFAILRELQIWNINHFNAWFFTLLITHVDFVDFLQLNTCYVFMMPWIKIFTLMWVQNDLQTFLLRNSLSKAFDFV